MANNEINNIEFNNTSTNTNFSPNNTATSDELLAPETFNYERPTNFEKLKRKIKVTKIAFFTITVSVTGGAIVVGLSRANIGATPPTIEAPSFKVENKTLIYSFKLSNLKNYKVTFTIYNDKVNLYNVELEKDDTYQNNYDLSAYSGSFSAILDYSNGVDHSGNLYTYNFTL